MKKSLLVELYSDICNGFSYSRKLDLYFKHFTTSDSVFCERERELSTEKAIANGIQSSDSILAEAIKNGKWSNQKESAIKRIESDYRRLSLAKTNPTSVDQLRALKEELKLIEEEWNRVTSERAELLVFSAESVGEKAYNEHRIFHSWYKDSSLTVKPYSFEDFTYLSNREYSALRSEAIGFIDRFDQETVSNICISDFFQRKFSISKDLYNFFGKPTFSLTDNQISLLKIGEKFNTMLSEIGDIPDDYSGPEGIEDWFYLKRAQALPTAEDLAKHKEMWD